MADYRTIRIQFWSDPYIESLDVNTKLLYLYLFSNSYTNNLGIAQITHRKISFETGLSQSDIELGLKRLEEDKKVIIDEKNNLIFLLNFIKNQTSTSPKMIIGLKKLALELNSTVIAQVLYKKYPDLYTDKKLKKSKCFYEDNFNKENFEIPYAYGLNTCSGIESEIGKEKEIGIINELENESSSNEIKDDSNFKLKPPLENKNNDLTKIKYGEHENVKLTNIEYEKLCQKYSSELTKKAIDLLDLHIGAKGKDMYKSHYLALQKWVFDAVKEKEMRSASVNKKSINSLSANAYSNGVERQYGNSDFGALG